MAVTMRIKAYHEILVFSCQLARGTGNQIAGNRITDIREGMETEKAGGNISGSGQHKRQKKKGGKARPPCIVFPGINEGQPMNYSRIYSRTCVLYRSHNSLDSENRFFPFHPEHNGTLAYCTGYPWEGPSNN